jgi:urease accessory protein
VLTSTSTSDPVRAGASEVVVRADAVDGRTVLRELTGVQPWRPRIVTGSGPVATVALVSTRATLIAGDRIRLSVTVGAGAALEVIEIGATVAHHARSGPTATVAVSLTIEPGASLVWCGQPLIAAAGCRASRDTVADVAAGGRLLLGDTVVLGRSRERAGALTARTRISCDGTPLMEETLDTRELETIDSPVVMGGSRLVRSLTLAGVLDDDPPKGSMRAAGPGMLWRSLETAERATADVAARWRSLVLGRPAAG